MLLVAPRLVAQYYTGVNLGSLVPSGYLSESFAKGINDSGMVVGETLAPSFATEAFSYSGGVMTDLGTLAGSSAGGFSEATAVNDAGLIVGESVAPGGQIDAFSYSGGVMTDLGTLGGTGSRATGVNDSGLIIGEIVTSGIDTEGFTDVGGVITSLGQCYPVAVSSSGLVVGNILTSDGYESAFSEEGGVVTDLGTFGGQNAIVTGVNDAGEIIGYIYSTSGGTTMGFSELGGVVTYLEPAGAALFVPNGINDTGVIVGTYYPNTLLDIPPRAYIDVGGVYSDLNPLTSAAGMETDLAAATGINNEGQIIGFGYEFETYLGGSGWYQDPFLLTPSSTAPAQALMDNDLEGVVPEQSRTALLFLFGVSVLVAGSLAKSRWSDGSPRGRASASTD